MSDGVITLTVVIGFAFILVAGSRLGAGSHHALAGLFPARGGRDWPTGVQEEDGPRFVVRHLDGLRRGQPVVIATARPDEGAVDAPPAELFDLGSRRLGASASTPSYRQGR
ncbi:MAG: hypothetical protein ACJ78H_04880 [Chloroflexota bacterium]